MSFPLLFKLTLYFLTLDALAALYLTDLVAGPTLGVVAFTLGASWWVDRLRPAIPNYRRLWEVITVVFLVYAVLDLALLADSFMAAMIHLLLFLLAYKLYNARSHRDLLDIFLLTFLMLVSAALLTTSFGFLLVFCLYMVLGVWGSILFHLRREADNAIPDRSGEALAAPGLVTPGFMCSSVGVAVASLILTLFIFFLIPRLGRTFLPLRGEFGALSTGFSDRVELGVDGTIQNDPTVVMRVTFPDEVVAPERLSGLRWRGVAFDHFDGRTWEMTDGTRAQVRRVRDGHFPVAAHATGAPFLSYEVLLEPIGTEILFGLPRITAIQGNFPALTVDAGGGLALPRAPGTRIRYQAVSQPERVREGPLGRSVQTVEYPPAIRDAYLQLPAVSPRVRQLAEELAAGARTPLEIARRVEAYLSENLLYTLDVRRKSEADPLDEFLFERKTGHCEYFAAAMAVLLRSAAVPARVVNGFQRGEWNDVGRYFAVRQRDAHSWVEAYIAGAGWLTFDPSPRAAFDAQAFRTSGRIAQYFDAMRMRWSRYVVDYNVGDQASVAMELRRRSAAYRGRLAFVWDTWSSRARRTLRAVWRNHAYTIVGVAVLIAALLVVCRHTRPGDLASAWLLRVRLRRTPVAFYDRMLRVLARRGYARAPASTAREFLTSLAERPQIQAPAAEITALYEQVRFGGETLSLTDGKRAATLLRQLETLPR